MNPWPVRFSEHAIDRMLEWRLDVDDVEAVLANGETIEEYEDGSRLLLGRTGTRPVHAVVADEEVAGVTIVITVYEPDPERWDASFRQRRRP
ncbi:MAG: DUF4258 domain-containing protein [Actinomycetota bacterium]|nr:DUF4258 domain-containing protein [Actinomycetota bacterium]